MKESWAEHSGFSFPGVGCLSEQAGGEGCALTGWEQQHEGS